MQDFQNKIRRNKAGIISLFMQIKESGGSIAGYGAPAKATTLIHYFGIADMIDFVVDDSPLKQGRFIPGTHIPIVPSEILYKKKPDYLIVLAWNFAEPIMQKIKKGGYTGKCIVPFP